MLRAKKGDADDPMDGAEMGEMMMEAGQMMQQNPQLVQQLFQNPLLMQQAQAMIQTPEAQALGQQLGVNVSARPAFARARLC